MLIVGGMISSGTSRTVSVCGRYWITSSIGVRSTTEPGVIARSPPTWYAFGGTMDGTRGGALRSRSRLRGPVIMLPAPVSIAAFHATGLSSGLLLGEAASTRFVTANPTFSASAHSSGASSTSPSAHVPVAR